MVKSDDCSIMPFFLKLALKMLYIGQFLFDFDNCFLAKFSLVGFPLNTMHIHHGKNFIEVIARNTCGKRKETLVVIQPKANSICWLLIVGRHKEPGHM